MPVPRPDRRLGQVGLAGTLDEPEDQDRVDETDEWRGTFNCLLLACGGVGESEQLLQISKADLNGPPARIAL